MEHPNEFQKLLRQIMSQECKPLFSKEIIDQSIREMEVFELVGDRWLIFGKTFGKTGLLAAEFVHHPYEGVA